MDRYFDQSDLIITHSGTSSIIKGLKKGKKIIVVPRQKKFDEHIDDHQLEIAMMFEKKGFIEVVYNINDLAQKIEIIKPKNMRNMPMKVNFY
ncbi:glycosyltransferase [Paenibacillus thailandensis]|uniref:glycosyltransferase n=1 Tax=Paenibacillus thailandensis TaxID=393250 RepID=UPI0036369556